MFFVLSKILDLAFEPIAWVIALVALGLALFARRSARRRLAIGSLAGAIVVLLVAANPMVANRLWWALERDAPSSYRADVEYDAVVLLGGLVPNGYGLRDARPPYGDGVERLLVTFDLVRADRAMRVIVSGGAPDVPSGAIPEGSLLSRQLQNWGIPAERIIVDDSALNTRQNATAVAEIARAQDIRRMLLVTSAFHMPRALGCFRAADLPVDTLPVDRRATDPEHQAWRWLPRAVALGRTSEALREYAGRLVYRVQGYAR